MCTWMYSMEHMIVRETCSTEVKMSQIYRRKGLKSIEEIGKIYDENVFAFFVLINSQLLAKHFYVLLCYFMKPEDSLEKR